MTGPGNESVETETVSFDIDGPVEDSTFEDIDTTADKFVRSKGWRGNATKRIRHRPRNGDDGIDWVKIGAVAGIVCAIVALLVWLT